MLRDAGNIPDTQEAVWQYPDVTMTWSMSLANSYGFDFQREGGITRRLGIYFHGVNGTLYADYDTHKVVPEERGRFLSVTGAKLTCFRSLAAKAGDAAMRGLGRRTPSRTHLVTLDGADDEAGRVEARTWLDVSADVEASGLPLPTLECLVSTYGRGYRRVVELAGKVPGGGERLCPANPEIVAQLHHAVQEERAVSLQDVLLRRTGIGTSACQGLDCAESIAERMGQLHGWTSRRLAAERDAYGAHVARSQRFREP